MTFSPSNVSVLDRALRILHLEDSPVDRELIHHLLESEGMAVDITALDNREQFLETLGKQSFDLVLSDQSLPAFDGATALRLVREKYPDLPFIFVTGSMGEEGAIETIKEGATDYVLKDRLNRLVPAIERAIREADQAAKNRLAFKALQESEERFQLSARASQDAIWDWNIESDSAWHSERIKHYGYLDEDIQRQGLFCVDHAQPAHKERVRAALTRVLRSRADYWSEEYPFLRKDGTSAHVFNRGYVIRDARGQAIRMVGAMMDITQRKVAEESVLQRTRLATLGAELINAVLAGTSPHDSVQKCAVALVRHLDVVLARIWTLDKEKNVLVLQASAGLYTHLNGQHSHIPVGKFKIGRIAQERKPHVTNNLLDDPGISNRDWVAHENIVSFGGYPLMIGDRLVGALAVFARHPLDDFAETALALASKEIALGVERRQSEEKIHEQAALLDKAQDAILVPGLNRLIRFWNKSAERLYGWTSAEALGKDFTRLLFKEESPILQEAIQSVFDKGKWSGELTQITKDGKEFIVKSHWSLVNDTLGKPECFLVVNTDITDKKLLEAQFLRAQRLESIGALASGIAHDLNNVLAPIMIGAAYLKDQISDESSKELLASIESSATRGAGIVKQLLSFARGAGGERQLLDPREIIGEIVKIIHETFPKTISADVANDSDLWTIHADPTQIHQVLLNLCVNARDAMPGGGRLSLMANNVLLAATKSRAGLEGSPGPYVRIQVRDTGSGMSPEVQEKVLEPFFTTKGQSQGTGLGLSTTVNILQSHGGLIDFESQLGKGTTFSIWFPAKLGQPGRIPVASAPMMTAGKQSLILLVEDETAIRQMCKIVLESCNFGVLAAENGQQAVALFHQHKDEIALVISDTVMPVMDGPSAVRAMRLLAPDLKVIFTTGLTESEQQHAIADLEDVRCLQKPYTAEKLVSHVADMLKLE